MTNVLTFEHKKWIILSCLLFIKKINETRIYCGDIAKGDIHQISIFNTQ